jgi:uncharacterized protein
VDIGVHQDGLVHVSQLSDNFVKDAAEVVKVSQRVNVTVTEVDLARGRIGLSMKSRPEIGGRSAGGPGGGGPRNGPGGPRSNATPAPRPNSAPASLNGDWFSAALNKKK